MHSFIDKNYNENLGTYLKKTFVVQKVHGIESIYAMLPSFMLLNDSCAIFPILFVAQNTTFFPRG